MRRPAFLLAVALVVLSNVVVLVHAWRNRGGESTAIELTERELRLSRISKDSSALFLEMNWDSWRGRNQEVRLDWFNEAKLRELGFDCRMPAKEAAAFQHYRSMPAREAFVVMEYRPEERLVEEATWLQARLFAVDAGREYGPLREKYADERRYLIAPGLVRIRLMYDAEGPRDARQGNARLQGWVVQPQVRQIAVPAECRAMLSGVSEVVPAGPTKDPAPRYAVVLRYGRLHEPWVESCRLLPVSTR
jgi:hypothetical protein